MSVTEFLFQDGAVLHLCPILATHVPLAQFSYLVSGAGPEGCKSFPGKGVAVGSGQRFLVVS